jgi:hypothetical protein
MTIGSSGEQTLKINYQFQDWVGRIFLENLERPQYFLVYLEHIVEPKTGGTCCILENETLSGASIPFFKMSCISLFSPVILSEYLLDNLLIDCI